MKNVSPTGVKATKATKAPALRAPVSEVLAQADAAGVTPPKPDAMAFAVHQLSTPVVEKQPVALVATIDTNSDEFKALLAAALANRTVATKAPKEPKAPRVARLQQNGETRPGEGTIGGRIWSVIDALSAKAGRPVSIAEVKAAPELKDDLVVNLTSIYARWRKFNGIAGRVAAPAPAAKPPVEMDFSTNP